MKGLLFVNAWLRVEEREQNFNLKFLASQLSEFIISCHVIFVKVLMRLCECNKAKVCLISYYMVCYYSTNVCFSVF